MSKSTKVPVFTRFGKTVAEVPKAVKIGEVEVVEYESLDEMRQALPGGDSDILKLANTQLATNIRNETRRQAQITTPSKSKLREQAEASLWDDPDNESLVEELVSIRDPVAKKARREQIIAQIVTTLEVVYEKKRLSMGSSVPVETETVES